MKQTGGLVVLPLPPGTADRDDLRLGVDVVREGAFIQPLMIEPELDFVLQSPRALFLASGEEAEVTARVYRNNRPLAGHPFKAGSQRRNPRSPVVVPVQGQALTTDADGRAVVRVQALDLNATGGVEDPVTPGEPLNALPFDRYYGNYLYLEMAQPLRRTNPPREQIEIAIRVVHRIKDILGVPSFRDDVLPRLFAYYLRYYPWLHTVETDGGYEQFLDLSDYASVTSHATAMLERLEKDITDPDRMPRSRDFPAGGVELFRRWVDTGMKE